MNEEQVQMIAAEVIRRLVVRLGGDGSRGTVVAVFTGATAAFNVAVHQVGALIIDGYRVQLLFSQAAEQLVGRTVREQLTGFPHVGFVEPAGWLSALKEAHAVIVPLLSVNTVSKLSMIIADNVVNNLILHALFMGKPVIAARNGADPVGREREELGFHKGAPALRQAVTERLKTLSDYGCYLTDVSRIKDTLNAVVAAKRDPVSRSPDQSFNPSHSILDHSGGVVTAMDIRHAHRLGAKLSISSSTLITPLARDLAIKHGVSFLKNNKR
jgi:hypothetical protein